MGDTERLYGSPQIPCDRLIIAGIASEEQKHELLTYRASLNPAEMTRHIKKIQSELINLAKPKTDALYLTMNTHSTKEKIYVKKITQPHIPIQAKIHDK